jgi:mannitol/fructose-specific phosphotransferase system IIA component (Ntr-type)
MNKVYFLLIFIQQQQQQQHQLKIISVFQIMTRQTAVRKQILDAYYIFKKDSELKKLIP